jgi:hypothetical protein
VLQSTTRSRTARVSPVSLVAESMASIEDRVLTAILTRIRRHRREAPLPNEGLPVSSPVAAASAKLRNAQFSDFEAVRELKRKWHLIPDPLENWERLWRHNPALTQQHSERPIGWVLEAEGKVVGYLGNISLLYRYGDQSLTAVASHDLVLESAYRAASLGLMSAFFCQKSIDLCLTTTAIEAVGKIARLFKSEPLPQSDYGTVLFWVLQSSSFARTLINKLDLGPSYSRIGRTLVSAAVGADRILHRRWPKKSSKYFEVREISPSEIGDDFEILWIAKLKEGQRLLADRSSAVLKWHFEIPGEQGTTRVLCCHSNRELVGYAIIRNETTRADGLRRSIIADALVKQDDPDILRVLFAAAYEHAEHAGSDVLEVLGFPGNIRQVCSEGNTYHRTFPSCPFYYKALDPVLHKSLSSAAAWYATPYDGDTTLMP